MKLRSSVVTNGIIGGLISIAPSISGTTKTKVKSQKPNIIFIMSDDHASNAISAYKSRLSKVFKTKNIDKLASEGAIFTNCFCTNSISTPSRASIITGKYSHSNGVKTLRDHFDNSQKTLPHYLQEAGYETALVGKWHLHSEPKGFDYWKVLPEQGDYFDPSFRVKGLDEKSKYKKRKTETIKGYVTDITTDITLDWIKNRKDTSKPFFMMCHHKAPHALWEYHKKYEHIFDGVTIPEPENLFEDKSHRSDATVQNENNLLRLAKRMSGQIKVSSVHNYGSWPTGNLDTKGMSEREMIKACYQKYLKDYLRVIASIDESVGRISRFLKDNGLEENTIVIYTSDQGMFLGEHQYLDKRWIFEESIKMPFIIKYPKSINANSQVTEMCSNVDFAPTLLEYAGVEKPSDMEGCSFKSVIEGEVPKDWQQSVYYRYWMHRDMTPAHYGIRTKRYKLIFIYGLNLDANTYGHANSQAGWELYDLEVDPNEINNVYNDSRYGEIREKLKKQLSELKHNVGDSDANYPEMLKIKNEIWNN